MLVLTFQIGPERLALDVRCITEVVPRVELHHLAGSPRWLAGVFVCRGQVVPVIDLHHLAGAGECPPHLSSRIILVPFQLDGEDRLLGLLAAQVADIRDIQPPAQARTRLSSRGLPDLGPVVAEGSGLLRLLDLGRLLADAMQEHLTALPRELPP